MKKAWCLAAVVLVASCGTKEKDEPIRGADPVPTEGSKDGNENYFQLMENCGTNSGKAVIDGKCVTLKVSTTLDGKLTLSSVETEKAIFDGGIGLAPVHSFPFVKYKRENTINNYSYSLKKQSNKLNERSISIDTTLESPNDVSSVLSVLADRSEARVHLDVFGEHFSPEDQDRASLEQVCNRIGKAFKDKHPLANSESTYGSGLEGSPICLVGNRRVSVDGLEDFKRIKLWWRCVRNRCYFEAMFLNGL